MSPIHWVASNGPMPERLNAADFHPPDTAAAAEPGVPAAELPDGGAAAPLADGVGMHTAAAVSFGGGRPSNALAVGIDSVDVPRLARVLERTPGMRDRCFTTTELVDAATGGDETGHLGTCFAAKEAVAKALGCGLGPVGFHDIELVRSQSGAPELELSGSASAMAAEAGIDGWLISATHTAEVAQTVVIALGHPPHSRS